MARKLDHAMDSYNPSVKAMHTRLKLRIGPAKNYNCIDCNKQALDWSLTHDTDYQDMENYKPRCRRCHILYDRQWERTGNLMYVPAIEAVELNG